MLRSVWPLRFAATSAVRCRVLSTHQLTAGSKHSRFLHTSASFFSAPTSSSSSASASASASSSSTTSKPLRIRKAFVMSVHKGFEAEYEKRHSPIWPELHAVLKTHGAHNYSIFLHPDTRQLFAFVEVLLFLLFREWFEAHNT